MNDDTAKLIEDIRRSSVRTPEQRVLDAEIRAKIDRLVASGEVSAEALSRGVLRERLKVHGHTVEVPGHGQLARLPTWTDGLFTDSEGTNFVFTKGAVERQCYDKLSGDVEDGHCSKLLRDLTSAGQLDLADPTMIGIVAKAWAFGEPGSASCIGYDEWRKLFVGNGFTCLGQHAERPTEPVTVYRGCTPVHRFGMAWSTEVRVARRFATERMSGRQLGNVYVARVEPDYLLAFIEDGHEEYEWVVDPLGLSDANVGCLELLLGD